MKNAICAFLFVCLWAFGQGAWAKESPRQAITLFGAYASQEAWVSLEQKLRQFNLITTDNQVDVARMMPALHLDMAEHNPAALKVLPKEMQDPAGFTANMHRFGLQPRMPLAAFKDGVLALRFKYVVSATDEHLYVAVPANGTTQVAAPAVTAPAATAASPTAPSSSNKDLSVLAQQVSDNKQGLTAVQTQLATKDHELAQLREEAKNAAIAAGKAAAEEETKAFAELMLGRNDETNRQVRSANTKADEAKTAAQAAVLAASSAQAQGKLLAVEVERVEKSAVTALASADGAHGRIDNLWIWVGVIALLILLVVGAGWWNNRQHASRKVAALRSEVTEEFKRVDRDVESLKGRMETVEDQFPTVLPKDFDQQVDALGMGGQYSPVIKVKEKGYFKVTLTLMPNGQYKMDHVRDQGNTVAGRNLRTKLLVAGRKGHFLDKVDAPEGEEDEGAPGPAQAVGAPIPLRPTAAA